MKRLFKGIDALTIVKMVYLIIWGSIPLLAIYSQCHNPKQDGIPKEEAIKPDSSVVSVIKEPNNNHLRLLDL